MMGDDDEDLVGSHPYVTDGRKCVGFVLARGRAGHEAFDREQRSLGMYPTAPEAANAVFRAAENERSAG